MNILIVIVAIIGGVAGLLSTLYCVISLIGAIAWKFYRRIVKGIPLTK